MSSTFFSQQFGWRPRAAPGDRIAAIKTFVLRWFTAFTVVLTAVMYYAGSRVGFALTSHDTPIAIFWPPNAILLAILLLAPVRNWWMYCLAVLPAHLLVQAQMGITVMPSMGWYISNTAEALIGAGAVLYLNGSTKRTTGFELKDTKALRAFLIGGVAVAPFLTSFLDAATAVRTGFPHDYWALWGTRLSSNVLSNLTLPPAIITVCQLRPSWFRKMKFARYLEAACLFLGTYLVSAYVFSVGGWASPNFSATMFAPLPFLFWAALRFGPGGLSSCLLIVSLTSLGNAMHGWQTLAADLAAKRVLTVQVLLGSFGAPLMWLSVLISERSKREPSWEDPRELFCAMEQPLRAAGRKLHGDLTQQLVLLSLRVHELISKTEPMSLREPLINLNQEIAHLFTTTRDWSNTLDPISIEYLGFRRAVSALCRSASERSMVRFSFSTEIEDECLDSISSLCLYRIVQDAIENIVSLGSAHVAGVSLEAREGFARLVVEHDGPPVNSERWQGNDPGMFSVRQRLALLNGRFAISSFPKGARIEVEVPCRSH